MISDLKGKEQLLNTVDWEKLEKEHSIVIEGNRAAVSSRRWLRSDKPLFTATAFLGTKAVDIKMEPHNNRRGSLIECDAGEILTESNIASQLKVFCMIILGEWDAAKRFVASE
jgi:hypothetical protein